MTLCVHYEQQDLPLRHPNDDEAFLPIELPIVYAVESECVIEYCLGQFKTHSVSFEVRLRLGGVPFKLQSFNLMILRETRSSLVLPARLLQRR